MNSETVSCQFFLKWRYRESTYAEHFSAGSRIGWLTVLFTASSIIKKSTQWNPKFIKVDVWRIIEWNKIFHTINSSKLIFNFNAVLCFIFSFSSNFSLEQLLDTSLNKKWYSNVGKLWNKVVVIKKVLLCQIDQKKVLNYN